MKLVGLTGKRGAGKSSVADALVRNGWIKIHAFGPGKAMSETFLIERGASLDEAIKYVHDAAYKDIPCPYLPINKDTGDHYACRYFMEKLGARMGIDFGAEWTLGTALDKRLRQGSFTPAQIQSGDIRIIVESVVYEWEYLLERGGTIIRLERWNADGTLYQGPVGLKTDETEARIPAAITIENHDGKLDWTIRAVEHFISRQE